MIDHDTIVAVSSPPGRAMRGLVRLSGPDVEAVLDQLLAAPSITSLEPRRLTAVRLIEPPLPALAALHHAPHSYTGEATSELQIPGHPALLERLLRQAIAHGARLAEPGEFTFRAFTAGKLDLTQAEGVAATITARSDSELRAAAMLKAGRLGSLAGELVEQLSNTLALVEAGIDFSDEEDVIPISPDDLTDRFEAMRGRLDQLLTRSRAWGEVEALPRVVLVGPPSSGKTALFNALLERPRGVVNPAPGTTRDVIEEPLTLIGERGESIEIMLVDLAGLDAPAGALDRQMQQTAQHAIDRADLLLCLRAFDQDDAQPEPLGLPDHAPRLSLLTKVDLAGEPARASREGVETDAGHDLAVSAVNGHNFVALKQQLAKHLSDRAASPRSDMLPLQSRHEQAIRNARERLDSAVTQVTAQRGGWGLDDSEVIADTMRGSLEALAGLGGRMSRDNVLGKVFATFCIGK